MISVDIQSGEKTLQDDISIKSNSHPSDIETIKNFKYFGFVNNQKIYTSDFYRFFNLKIIINMRFEKK